MIACSRRLSAEGVEIVANPESQRSARIPSGEAIPKLAASYRSASPWPHIRLDGIIEPELIAAAYEQELAHAPNAPKTAYQGLLCKSEMAYAGLGPAAQEILQHLDGPEFVAFLRKLTGVDDLESDPTHAASGLYANGPGNYHGLHHDLMMHPTDGRWHRANLLVYLNPVWPEEYGGALELWGDRGRSLVTTITPVAPTIFFFETPPEAIHGLPDPVACPSGDFRLNLSARYYSVSRPSPPPLSSILRVPRGAVASEIRFHVNTRMERTACRVRNIRRRYFS